MPKPPLAAVLAREGGASPTMAEPQVVGAIDADGGLGPGAALGAEEVEVLGDERGAGCPTPSDMGVPTARTWTCPTPSDMDYALGAGSSTDMDVPTAAEGLHASEGSHGPTREALMEQGISGTQADAILVRVHQEEVLMVNFRRWIQCFSIVVCLLTPAMMGIMIWMMVEYSRYRKVPCDVPLQMWCLVVATIVVFNMTVNRPGRNGSFIARFVCRWTPDPEVPRMPPMRVRLYNGLVALFIFSWNIYGLALVVSSGSSSSEEPACVEVTPELFSSVKFYVALNLTFTVFFYVNMVGFSRVLALLLRRGMLHTDRAAPKGTLEDSTEVVEEGAAVLLDQSTCPVCLDEYATSKDALKIKACGHVFHKQCLQGWLNVNRNCPVCRRDLTDCAAPG